MKVKAFLSVLVVAVAGLGFAQDLFSATSTGSGNFRVGRDNTPFSRMTLIIQDDKDVFITMEAGRNISYTGKWTSRNGNRYEVEFPVSSQLGAMRGSVEVDRDYVRRISVSTSGGTEAVSIDWSGRGPVGGNEVRPPDRPTPPNQGWQGNISFNGETRGRSTFNRDGQRETGASVRASVDRSGRVVIDIVGSRFEGERPRNYRFEGTARRQSGNRVDFDLTRTPFGRQARGSGSVTLTNDRRSIENVRFNGTDERTRFDYSFTRGFEFRGALDGSGRLDDGRFQDDLRRIDVNISRDGRFSIRTDSYDRIEISGRWTERGDTLILEAERVTGLSRIRIRGDIRLDASGRITRISLSGDHERGRFSMNFSPR